MEVSDITIYPVDCLLVYGKYRLIKLEEAATKDFLIAHYCGVYGLNRTVVKKNGNDICGFNTSKVTLNELAYAKHLCDLEIAKLLE